MNDAKKGVWKVWVEGWKEEDAKEVCISDLRVCITPEPWLVATTVLEEWISGGAVCCEENGHIPVYLIDPEGKKYIIGVDVEWEPVATATTVKEVEDVRC